MNGLEIYNEILQNTHNLKGTWEVTENNYLNVTGNTNGSIVLFDKTVGALGDFILEWTAEQKGGSYIHSNLCPSLRYTPEDAGTEGGGDNYAMLVYLCNYGGNPGTFNLRTEGGTKSEINTSGVSLNIDTVYTFKLERLGGMYRLYQDGILINEATDITKKKLYLGWYLWYGGTNSDYQTNFILREYNLTKIDTKSYLDSIGLTTLWSKIKSLFATKTELGSKANDSDVVHKSGNETIAGSKTFSSNIVGNLTGNADTAIKATQDSDGNQINTTYAKNGHLHNDWYYSKDEVNNLLNGKANDSGVVHKSGDETIAGSKTFSYRYILRSSNLVFGNATTGNLPGNHTYQDKNGTTLGSVGLSVFNDYKYTINGFTINNPYYLTDNTSPQSYSVGLRVEHNDGSAKFFPDRNGLINLGGSSNKWKNVYANTFNGINPGALSLPSNNSIDILSTLQSNGYTAPSNGYVRAIKNVKTECTSTFGIRNETTGIEDRRIAERVFVIGVIVPVKTGEKVIISDDWNSISNVNITYSASFYPCIGNV